MALDEKWALGLAGLSIVLLAVGWLLATRLSTARPSTFRVAVPTIAVVTLLSYVIFVTVARVHVKG